MEDKFHHERLNKLTINDKELIHRIWKNTKKNSFNYLDSIDILKNKNYAYIQLSIIIIIAIIFFFIAYELNIEMFYLLFSICLLFCYITYLKIQELEKLVEKERDDARIKTIKKQIESACKELFEQMSKAGLDEKLKKYTKEILTQRLTACETSKDYDDVLHKIKDETNKYKKISKEKTKTNFKMEKDHDDKIVKSYRILQVKKEASLREVRTNYKKLIKKYHPDNHQSGNEIKIRELNEAYSILKEYLNNQSI